MKHAVNSSQRSVMDHLRSGEWKTSSRLPVPASERLMAYFRTAGSSAGAKGQRPKFELHPPVLKPYKRRSRSRDDCETSSKILLALAVFRLAGCESSFGPMVAKQDADDDADGQQPSTRRLSANWTVWGQGGLRAEEPSKHTASFVNAQLIMSA